VESAEREMCVLGPDENYVITMKERGEWSGPTYLLTLSTGAGAFQTPAGRHCNRLVQ
jgi:hypothetical protein